MSVKKLSHLSLPDDELPVVGGHPPQKQNKKGKESSDKDTVTGERDLFGETIRTPSKKGRRTRMTNGKDKVMVDADKIEKFEAMGYWKVRKGKKK